VLATEDQGEAHVAAPDCRRRRRGPLALLVLLALVPRPASGDLVTDDPNKVKAAFLRHFAHYVTWPPGAAPDKDAPWCIGILGADPFGAIMEKTLQGQVEQGHTFIVRRAEALDELPACHIVYITYPVPEQRRAVLARFKGKPVLTVGEAPEFLQEGGVVLLEIDGRVRMSINLDQARGATLKVQTKLLEVSTAVLENGELRRVR